MALTSGEDSLISYIDNSGGAVDSTLKLYNVSSDEIFSHNDNVHAGQEFGNTALAISSLGNPIVAYKGDSAGVNQFIWVDFDPNSWAHWGLIITSMYLLLAGVVQQFTNKQGINT